MSAIAGIWHFDGKPSPGANCARMLAAQTIYGPHDGRQWCEGTLAMGRRLFRTLPEDRLDRQPLHSRDRHLTLTADVRLDNRQDLTAALSLPFEQAQRQCDAVILLACLERWGEAALDRLVGDFAFALWDGREQRFMLARDFAGQRPLHYHRGRGFFAFASMPKGLLALADIPSAPDEQAMAEFLALMPQSGPRSFHKDIERVEAGHVLKVTRDKISSRQYWQPRRGSSPALRSGDYVEGLRHHLDLAVGSTLRRSDGGIGAHLSAGLDSASVTATAARLTAQDSVVAFTSVPREGYAGAEPRNRINDEGPLAAATAALYPNIEHVLIRAGHLFALDNLERIYFLFDRPILNIANTLWSFAILQAARERGLKILLTGEMGNMTLSYAGLELLGETLRAGRLLRLRREAAMLVARSGMRWRGVLAQTLGPFVPAPLWQWLNESLRGEIHDILHYTAIHPQYLAASDLAVLARERDLDFSYRPWADGFAMRRWVLGRSDRGNYTKGILAGWGIDRRMPLIDKRLVEFCLSVPTEQYLADGVPRAMAKRAMADRLPQAVLNERKKGYQAADWHEGLTAARGQVAHELNRLQACAPASKLLDLARLKQMVANWPASGWERSEVRMSYRAALLRGISAGHFLRKASGSNL